MLAAWVAAASDDDIPDAVRIRGAHLLLDGIGCGLVGAQLPWSRTAVAAMLSVEEPGSHALIGWSRRASGQAAAVLNSTFIQGFELDDYHLRAPLHSGAVVIPALLATAEDLGGVGGRALLTAAVVGFEVGPRVGMALHGAEMLTRGWHSGSVFGTHAAAAAAGKLRRLDGAAVEDALGMAGTQSGGLMAAQYEAMSKRMHHGFAARSGYYAAVLAAHGYTGIKRVFEREYGGFLSTFGEGHDPEPEHIAHGLGERWETDSIAIKRFAAMGGLQGPIEAALQLRSDGIEPREIEHIDISVSRAVYHHGWWDPVRPLTAIGAQMNVGYAVAAALTAGEVLAEQFAPARLDDDEIWKLIDRTSVRLEAEFDEPGGPGAGATWLRITTGSGRIAERKVLGALGTPARPLTNDQIRAKFRSLTSAIVAPARLEEIRRQVIGLDDDRPIEDLIGVLADDVGTVL